MNTKCRYAITACLMIAFVASLARAQTVATPVLSKDLPEFAGKEVVVSTVVYPPAVASPPHRHDAHTFVYVLEGSVVM